MRLCALTCGARLVRLCNLQGNATPNLTAFDAPIPTAPNDIEHHNTHPNKSPLSPPSSTTQLRICGPRHWEQDKEATVYIGNLDERVSDALVWELMLQAGRIVSFYT
jgi:hypothetical protein